MKVGDLVRFKNSRSASGKVYLIVRTGEALGRLRGIRQKVWVYPDPDDYLYTNNHYYDHVFEVVSESR